MDMNNDEIPTAARKRVGHPGKIKDETGNRYGRLLVLRIEGRNISEQVTWRCLCDCGKETVQAGSTLRAGTVVSCGCYGIEARRAATKTHGLSETAIYGSHAEMVRRCTSDKHISWANYGGRGIKVCERWLKFENFYEDMAAMWKPDLSIERKDVNGDYCPENCCWATDSEQNRNKRNTKRIDYNGESLTKTEWAERAGISLPLFRERQELGWSMERILSTPPYHSANYKRRATP